MAAPLVPVYGASVDAPKLLTLLLQSPGKLTSQSTFYMWRESLLNVSLLYPDMYRVLTGDPPAPLPEGTPDSIAFRDFSRKIFSVLFTLCDSTLFDTIRPFAPSTNPSCYVPAQRALEALTAELLKHDTSTALLLFREFMSLSGQPYKGSSASDMNLFIAKYSDLNHRNVILNVQLPEFVICMGLVSALPYTHFSTAISSFTGNKDQLKLSIIRPQLLALASTQALSLPDGPGVSVPNVSLLVEKPELDRKIRVVVCWNCGKKGHSHQICRAQKDEDKIKAAYDAFKARKAGSGGADTPFNGRSRANSVATVDNPLQQAGSFFTSFSVSSPELFNVGLWDGGSSIHLCSKRSFFTSFTLFPEPRPIGGINSNYPVLSLGFGCVTLRLQPLNQMSTADKSIFDNFPLITFRDVHLVTSSPLPFDLIVSTTTFVMRSGYDFCVRHKFGGDAFLERVGYPSLRFVRHVQANQHLFSFEIITPPVISSLPSSLISISNNNHLSILNRVHILMGHMSVINIQRLMKAYKIPGVPSGFKVTTHDISTFKCDSCCLGKSKSVSFKTDVSSTRSSRPLFRIHVDVEFFPVPAIDGETCSLTILDDCSRKLFTGYFNSKDKVTPFLLVWIRTMQVKYDCVISELRSDSGKEFCNNTLESFLQSNGTKFIPTLGYSPERNGKIERPHLTLTNLVLSMFHSANLTSLPRFWRYCHAYAVIYKNLTPHSVHNFISYPSLIFDYSFHFPKRLHPFGCICFPHITAKHRKKLDLKSYKGIYLGPVNDLFLDHFVYDLESGKIWTENNIPIFHDDIFLSLEDLRIHFPDVDFNSKFAVQPPNNSSSVPTQPMSGGIPISTPPPVIHEDDDVIILNESSRSPSVAQSYDNDVDPGIDQQSPLRADDDNDIPDIPLSRSISLDSYRPNNSPQISLDSNTPFYIGFSI